MWSVAVTLGFLGPCFQNTDLVPSLRVIDGETRMQGEEGFLSASEQQCSCAWSKPTFLTPAFGPRACGAGHGGSRGSRNGLAFHSRTQRGLPNPDWEIPGPGCSTGNPTQTGALRPRGLPGDPPLSCPGQGQRPDTRGLTQRRRTVFSAPSGVGEANTRELREQIRLPALQMECAR